MLNRITKLFRDEAGATMVEYALMVALIALVCIVAVTSLGGNVRSEIGEASDEMAR